MHQIYPDEGLIQLLQRLVTASVRYHLFVNNVTIDRGTVHGVMTEQGGGSGYVAVDVVAGAWTASGITSHIGSLVAPPISFTPVGASWTLYGYFVTDSGLSDILWAANFDGAPITVPDGTPLLITPIVGDFSRYSS